MLFLFKAFLVATIISLVDGSVCPLYDETDPLQTSLPPFIGLERSGFFHLDILTLTIAVSTKFHGIGIDFEDASSDAASLMPSGGSSLWNSHSDACWTNYTLSIPWAHMTTGGLGGLIKHEYPSRVSFTGVAVVTTHESIMTQDQGVELSHTRRVTDKLVFVVEFPKFVDAAVHVGVFSSPVELAAIIQQSTGALSPYPPHAEITVDILTVLQSPYKYDPSTLRVHSNNPDLAHGLEARIHQDCPNIDAECEQIWRFHIYPTQCVAQGTFTIHIQLQCQPAFAQHCPLDTTTNDDVIEFEITSSNFCPQTIETIGLHASLTVFRDPSHTIPKDAFIHGQTAFFRATAGSNEASLAKTEVVEILTFSPYYALFVPLNHPPFPYPAAHVEIAPWSSTPPNEAWFAFVIAASLFPVPPSGAMIMQVQCTLKVEFAHNDLLDSIHPSMAKLLADNEVRQLEIAEEISVEPSADSALQSSSSTTSSSSSGSDNVLLQPSFVALLSVVLFFVGAGAGFIIHRMLSRQPVVVMEQRKSSGIDVESIKGTRK